MKKLILLGIIFYFKASLSYATECRNFTTSNYTFTGDTIGYFPGWQNPILSVPYFDTAQFITGWSLNSHPNHPGLYGINNGAKFVFNGSNQTVSFQVYGLYNQYNQMGFSINGHAPQDLVGSFPMTIGGIYIELDTSLVDFDNWETAYLKFTGPVNDIKLYMFEAGIKEVCTYTCYKETIATNESTTGAADGSATIISSSSSFLWSNGENTSTATGLTQGWYYVTATGSCTAIDSVYISVGTKTRAFYFRTHEDFTTIDVGNPGAQDAYCNGLVPEFYSIVSVLGYQPGDTVLFRIDLGDGTVIDTFDVTPNYFYANVSDSLPRFGITFPSHTYAALGSYDVRYDVSIKQDSIYSLDTDEVTIINCNCNLAFSSINVVLPTHIDSANGMYEAYAINSSYYYYVNNEFETAYGRRGHNIASADPITDSTILTSPHYISGGGSNITSGNVCIKLQDFVTRCYIDTCFMVTVDSSLVWPGDADFNGTANVFDVFPIGINYGSVGPLRINANSTWVGQPSSNWMQNLGGSVNKKHSDCDGNGTINVQDGQAILLNYGLVHNKGDESLDATTTDPELFFDIPLDTALVSDSISIPILLGTTTTPINNVYGVAFTINFDPALVDTNTIKVTFNNSWLGTLNNNFIAIQKKYAGNGKLHVGMVRTTQQNIGSAFGQIAELDITVADDLAGKTNSYKDLNLTFTDVKVISLDETEIPVQLLAQTIVISDGQTGIKTYDLNKNIRVYPNPTNESVNITLSDGSLINKISVYNQLGELMMVEKTNTHKTSISLQALNNGVYYINIETSAGSVVKKITKL